MIFVKFPMRKLPKPIFVVALFILFLIPFQIHALDSPQMVKDINSQLSPPSLAAGAATINKIIFPKFEASVGTELFVFDVETNIVSPVSDITPGPGSTTFSGFKALNGGSKIIFMACLESLGCEPWVTDGSNSGTTLLKDIAVGADSSMSYDVIVATSSNLAYFVADNGSVGSELWQTDGTPGGTVLAQDINPGRC